MIATSCSHCPIFTSPENALEHPSNDAASFVSDAGNVSPERTRLVHIMNAPVPIVSIRAGMLHAASRPFRLKA